MNENNQSRILVVDDNDINLLVATTTLDDLGYSYDLAKDGMAAVELCAKEKYIIILMDIQMPEMSGYEAIQQIRAYELKNDRPRTPVIVVTANANFLDESSHLSKSMDGFIIKPYGPEALAKVIKTHGSIVST